MGEKPSEIDQELQPFSASDEITGDEPVVLLTDKDGQEKEKDDELQKNTEFLKELAKKLANFCKNINSQTATVTEMIEIDAMSQDELDKSCKDLVEKSNILNQEYSRKEGEVKNLLDLLQNPDLNTNALYISFETLYSTLEEMSKIYKELEILAGKIIRTSEAYIIAVVKEFNENIDNKEDAIDGNTIDELSNSLYSITDRVGKELGQSKRQYLKKVLSKNHRKTIELTSIKLKKLYDLREIFINRPERHLPTHTYLVDNISKAFTLSHAIIQKQFDKLYSENEYDLDSPLQEQELDQEDIVKIKAELLIKMFDMELGRARIESGKYDRGSILVLHDEELISEARSLVGEIAKMDWNNKDAKTEETINNLPHQLSRIFDSLSYRNFGSEENFQKLISLFLNYARISRKSHTREANLEVIGIIEGGLDLNDPDQRSLSRTIIDERYKLNSEEEELDRQFSEISARDWSFLRDTDIIKEYGTEIIAGLDRFWASRLKKIIYNESNGNSEVSNAESSLINFRCAEAIPTVLIILLESMVHFYSGDGIYNYLSNIPKEEIDRLIDLGYDDLAEALIEARSHKESFEQIKIKNPERINFEEQIKNDPLLLETLVADRFTHFNKIKISDTKPKDRFGEEVDFTYDDSGTMIVFRERFLESMPDLDLSREMIDDPEEILQIKIVFAKKLIANLPVKEGWEEKDRVRDEWNSYREISELVVGVNILKFLLKKYDVSQETFDTDTIENSIFANLRNALVKYLGAIADKGDLYQKIFVAVTIPNIAESRVDLSDIYGKIFDEVSVCHDQSQLKRFVTFSIDRFNSGDQQYIGLFLGRIESSPVFSDLKFRLMEIVVQNKIDLNASNLEKLAQVFEIEPEKMDKIIKFSRTLTANGQSITRFGEKIKWNDLFLKNLESVEEINSAVAICINNLGEMDEWMKIERLNEVYAFVLLALQTSSAETAIFFLKNTSEFIRDAEISKLFLQNADILMELPPESLNKNISIILKIIKSPSQEVQKIRNQLIEQIITSENPEESYDQITQIFERNNLPHVAKVFMVFQILHKGPLDKNAPEVFGAKTTIERKNLFYSDLLRIHALSGNRSLLSYLEILEGGQRVLDQVGEHSIDGLDPTTQRQLDFFLRKIEALFENSTLGIRSKIIISNKGKTLSERYQELRHSLRVREGQKVTERISQMFLRPLGVETIGEAISLINDSIIEADQRNRRLFDSWKTEDGVAVAEIEMGDFIKGVDSIYIDDFLQNGSVAKEFLGSGSSSDATPLDTDMSQVLSGDLSDGLRSAISTSLASGYGDGLMFVFRNRSQFSDAPDKPGYQAISYGDRHFGVRTGLPSSEIDYMILRTGYRADINKIFYAIARNGFYIPVCDESGKVIFTPEIYDEYKQIFDGIETYHGNPFKLIRYEEMSDLPDDARKKIVEQIKEIETKKEADRDNLVILREVDEYIDSLLQKLGIERKRSFDTGLIGAEFMETGSTSRGTDSPGDFDYDFALRLDDMDFGKLGDIVTALGVDFKPELDESHSETNYHQIRFKKITTIAGRPLSEILGKENVSFDLDIGISKKSELIIYASHDAIADKLGSIRKQYGEEAVREVQASVVLAKRILKEGHAYKKLEDHGFGGIGVENWLLAYNGNMILAFRSFLSAALDEKGEIVPFDDFKRKYHLRSAGSNIKRTENEDFIWNLWEDGYIRMVETIKKWFNDNNIS